jgi:hypothetical protein
VAGFCDRGNELLGCIKCEESATIAEGQLAFQEGLYSMELVRHVLGSLHTTKDECRCVGCLWLTRGCAIRGFELKSEVV